MISCTLNQYKNSFKTNLLAFLNEYEDNTKAFFLQNEKTKYQAYQKALTKIADQMKFFTREELNQNLIHRTIAADLKKIDQNIYNSIVTELNPVQNETTLSLSAAKKDRIKIDETALENHIKSSIVILKFISEENTETKEVNKFTYPSEDGETGLKLQTDGQLDSVLEKWLNIYEANFEYLTIPMVIEEKADYVIDTYNNYQERYYKYQIDVCDRILSVVPNDKIILNARKKFQHNIIKLREQHPIPCVNIEAIILDINNAFYRLEKFMEGSVVVYQSFLFYDAFTIFFNELNKIENITAMNHHIRDGYQYFISQLYYAYDKSEFKNLNAFDNEDFNRDCNELFYINYLMSFDSEIDDFYFKMPSIIDIIKPLNNSSEIINIDFEDKLSITDEENPYPRIFTSHKAFGKFKKLKEEFGNTKQNLSNYSFVYHRMIKDKLIFEDYKQTEFVFFLLNFEINISRIKPKNQLGNNDFRESIYNSIK